MAGGYFYSKSTGLFVAREPLRIDARIIEAATFGDKIELRWDDEGRINNLNFLESLYLLQNLGGTMMTVREFWQVLTDAEQAGDSGMISQLQSDHYAEWLNTIFESKEMAIEHVQIIKKDGHFSYQGSKRPLRMPYGHPGWFNTETVETQTGLPHEVELNREKHSTAWKYWSFCNYPYVAAAVRGWVTSVGKPSLDLGIPISARQPNLLVRECRRELPRPLIDPEILATAQKLVVNFQTRVQDSDYAGLYERRANYLDFVRQYGHLFRESSETVTYKIRERLIELLGILHIYAKGISGPSAVEIAQIARTVWGLTSTTVQYDDFTTFVETGRARLQKAIKKHRPIVFVTGHKNPDTDTVVSALAEAYRNHLIDGEAKTYIPIVQGDQLPMEIAELLENKLANNLIFTADPAYQEIAHSGQARWIMVDHSFNPEIQKFVISIIDHHIPSAVAKRQDIPKTIEVIGSTGALIAQRFYGLGLNLDPKVAKLLYGATLMDTENRSPLKITARDILLMDDLKATAGIRSDKKFYRHLMESLLNTDDADHLFRRDYKEDWGFFGFAVAKVKYVFDRQGQIRKPALVERLVEAARKNNRDKNLPLTLIKLVDYLDDNNTVNHERVYLIFKQPIFPGFRESMFNLLEIIIKSTFAGRARVTRTDEFIEFRDVGDQLSRKRIVPLLEPVAAAFNRYFYSPTTGLYAKREFLKISGRVRAAAEKGGLKLSVDSRGRVNHITFGEAICLLGQLGFTALSLPDYWQVLADAKRVNDQQMIAHLQSKSFVEFLNTLTEKDEAIINKPEILLGQTKFKYEGLELAVNYNYRGIKQKVQIPVGAPGLIAPNEIDPDSGLPTIVHPPDVYDNQALWRYWSPDAEKNVATRGYIFLLDQPALDLKVHLTESFPCLGIRPCCKEVEAPKIEVVTDKDGVILTIWEEGEKLQIREADLFKDLDS